MINKPLGNSLSKIKVLVDLRYAWINKQLLCFILLMVPWSLSGQSTKLSAGGDWEYFLERLEILSGQHAPQLHSSLKPFERKAAVSFALQLDTSKYRITDVDRQLIVLLLQQNAEWSKKALRSAWPKHKQIHQAALQQAVADSSDWQIGDASKRIPFLEHVYAYPTDLFRVHDEEFFFVVNPVLELNIGKEGGNKDPLFINTRGIEMRGLINQRVGFYSFIAENQARFPAYVNSRRNEYFSGSVPGEGWAKSYKESGVDFFTARAHLSLQATRNIGLQFGHDRASIGSGLRSLLLSDLSNNYLFFRINTRYKIFHYQNTWARLIDYPMRTYGRAYDHKYSVTHHLSLNISSRLQLGFFENVISGRSDPDGRRGLDPHYLVPVIFYRAIEHHVGDPDKVALGIDWRWLALPGLSLYGQVYIDEFRIEDVRADLDSLLVRAGIRKERKYDGFASFANKFALQLGSRIADPFGIPNLDIQAEINLVRPYVYSHYDVSEQGIRPGTSYSHYSQPLGHPLGANFREWAMQIHYRPHAKITVSANLIHYMQGRDTDGLNYGGNIMQDYRLNRPYENSAYFLDGLKTKVQMADLLAGWQFRPGWHVEAGYQIRKEQGTATGMVHAGLRVNVSKRTHHF